MSEITKRSMKTKYLIQASIIAAVYVAITIAFAPISYGYIQVRISEALTILPFFTPAAIPGLFVGCFIANFLGPLSVADLIIGSSASLIASVLSYKLRHRQILVPLPPVTVNGVMIGAMLYFIYGVPVPLWMCMAFVTVGQIIACYGIGYPLLCFLKKYRRIFE